MRKPRMVAITTAADEAIVRCPSPAIAPRARVTSAAIGVVMLMSVELRVARQYPMPINIATARIAAARKTS